MLTRMLKKDLKRNKTMNIILFLFVIIASLFFASGLYNVVAVMNGSDYFFNISKIGQYQIITLGEDNIKGAKEKLDGIDVVKSYRTDECIAFSKEDVLDANGKVLEVHNLGLLQNPHEDGQVFFDADNNEIKSVEKGKFYVSHKFLVDNGTKVGDKLTFKKGSVEIELEYAGLCKDAFLGSDFMGNPRFLVNEEDFNKFMEDEEVKHFYTINTFLIDCDDTTALTDKLDGIYFLYSYPVSMLELANVMNMIVAMLVIILSVCLMIVSFVVLKFSITFSIDEDFSEIGVMKAIGLKDHRIRRLYIIKYTAISIVGSVIGLLLSIPVADLLLKFSTETMVLGTKSGLLLEIIGAVVVALLVIFFAYMSTRKIKKLTAIDAVRSGQTGERYKKKGGIRLSKFRSSTSSYLAINDFLSSPKRFLNILISFALCMILVLLIVNTTETMNSDKLAFLFGSQADLYITDGEKVTGHLTYDQDYQGMADDIAEMEQILKDNGMPAKVTVPLLYNTLINYDGSKYKFNAMHEYDVPMSEYVYTEGSAPSNKNEIAITEQIVKETGASIGDSVKMDIGNGDERFLITAIFQSMNNTGQIILLHCDAEPSFKMAASILQYRVNFNDSPDQATIDQRAKKVNELLDVELVQNKTDYCKESVQVYDTMKLVQRLLLAITIVVVILVTILMERSFIADEKKDIAIAKAIGFNDSRIIKWHVLRFFIVAVIAMVIAVVLAIPMTHLCITPIFGLMGATSVDYNYGLAGLTLYPLIILVVTVITTALTALYTKKITSNDTASIE